MSLKLRSVPSRAADAGSAVVEFVLVGALLVLLAAGLFQLALTLHVRNILLSSASEGAHVGALADLSPADGAARASDLARAALGGLDVVGSARAVPTAGGEVVEVTLAAPVPVLGLWGAGSMSVTAHAIEEAGDE
ncbi:TadE/TadG family type IV pilus assembly protein [Demequina sp.]|uniref:TadE/TadG family type IV pilus assembly protein n=1 Tax=Demequina sp. TaxID=2050685 RepID=UPI003D0C113F